MNTITPSDPKREQIQQLLDRAAALPPSERDVFLSAECGDDGELRSAVYAHLLAEARGQVKKVGKTGPVTNALRQALSGTAHDRRVELLGAVVGDYRLSAILGAGGAGTVYLAERADRHYSAQVAIKVVANTALNNELQRRFLAERQILANLNHPYIARLLDAGETHFDEPFLVMEYVHGEPIDRYCDNQRLTVAERLRLFIKVCEAVQYAHRNLIVHRDIKPGNILVAKDGTPKLLDFGIAKLLDDSAQAVLQDGVMAHTRVHDRLLTPEYASPEQIRGQPVTTTSDVYALGMVLYELLTGTRPYPINDRNQLELERSICIQDVIKPSQRMAQLASQETHDTQLIAQAHRTSLKKLQSQLQGDLDAIVLRALRKEPEHRYSSVEHLIEDLTRHLSQEPVAARQGNRWYYTQRFIKRHTAAVLTGSLALLALIVIAIAMSIQAKRLAEQRDIAKQQRDKATQESSRAESVSNFMLEVFTAADPFQSQDKVVTAKELLDKAANKIETSLNDQLEVKARLLEAIGEAYLNQGQSAAAIEYLGQALTIRRKHPGSESNLTALVPILNSLGRAYINVSGFENADRMLMEARNYCDNSNDHTSNIRLQTDLYSGLLKSKMGQPISAQHFYEEGLEIARTIYGSDDKEVAGVMVPVAQSMMWQSNYRGAEPVIKEAVRIYQRELPPKHPDRLSADIILGELLYHLGQYDEALIVVNQTLFDQKIVFEKNNSQLVNTYNVLSKIYLAINQLENANRAAFEGLKIAKQSFGDGNFMVGVMHSAIASVLIKQKNYRLAEQESTSSLNILKREAYPDHQYLASAEYMLAASLVGQHRSKEAEPILRENILRWKRGQSPVWRAARSESLLGIALIQLGRYKEAGESLQNSYQVLLDKESHADIETIEAVKNRTSEYQQCMAQKENRKCQPSE